MADESQQPADPAGPEPPPGAGQGTPPNPESRRRRRAGHGAPGHGSKVRKRDTLIANLLTCDTYAQAAERSGLSLSTVQRWLRDPCFQADLKAARRAVVDQTVSRLAGLSAKAATALERNLDVRVPSAEIRSALGILDNVKSLLVSEEQDERFQRLEQAIEDLKRELKP